MKTIKGKVVLLDSKNYSAITYTAFLYSALIYSKHYKLEKGTKDTYKHLYITSDEEIKEGDWVIFKNNPIQIDSKRAFNEDFITLGHVKYTYELSKIIATTDKSLNLPSIPQSFIDTYIEEYNKVNVIEGVEIEIEPINQPETFKIKSNINYKGNFKLKINSNNEISIKPIKDSWNREEVIALCKQAYFDGHYEGGSNVSGPMMSDKCSDEEWIKENL